MITSRKSACLSLAGCVVALSLLLAGPAGAEVRTATIEDPADASPTISGVPYQPDIRQVFVSYDTAGTLTVTASFYNAFDSIDTSSHYAFFGEFEITAARPSPGAAHCSVSWLEPEHAQGFHHVYKATPGTFQDYVEFQGVSGKLPLTRVTSADQKQVTVSATHSILAGRNYNCVRYTLWSRELSSFSNPNSRYDADCDCWYLESPIDYTGFPNDYEAASQNTAGVWFAGFQPPPYVPTRRLEKTYFGVIARGRCRHAAITYLSVGPDQVAPYGSNFVEQPFGAKVAARIDGKRLKRIPVGTKREIRWGHVLPGWHTLRLYYPGDEWRLPGEYKKKFRVGNCRGRRF